MLQLIQQFMPNVYRMGWSGQAGWGTAIYLTLYMTIIPFFIGGILGFIAGLLLVLTGPRGILENRLVFFVLDKVTSIFRAIPFIILLAVFPFFARQVQVVLSELDRGVIEAAQASGATFWDIVGVYLREGLPDLIRVTTVTLISLVGETAMAGAIGAGGLGNVALTYGYQRFNHDVTILATILILLLIFFIQFVGDFLTRKISHR